MHCWLQILWNNITPIFFRKKWNYIQRNRSIHICWRRFRYWLWSSWNLLFVPMGKQWSHVLGSIFINLLANELELTYCNNLSNISIIVIILLWWTFIYTFIHNVWPLCALSTRFIFNMTIFFPDFLLLWAFLCIDHIKEV